MIRMHLALVPVAALATGCSVFMAASGTPDANIGAITIGQPRETVLVHLGQPARTVQNEGGMLDVFELERGNEPSIGRAALHGAMDLLTFGAWEIIATPMEAFAGEKYQLTVEYDDAARVKRIYSGSASNVGTGPRDM